MRSAPRCCPSLLLEAIFLLASSNFLFAQSPPTPPVLAKCAQAEVRSLKIEHQTGSEIAVQEPARVLSQRSATQGSPPTLLVTALGPLLGNMDSPDLDVETVCIAGRLELHATILRSADYQDSVLKYAPWRPQIVLTVAAKPGATLTTRWKMLLTSGEEVHRSRLPGAPETAFPIVLHAVLLPPLKAPVSPPDSK